ncbi:MAG: SOS response-associated peptidase family protein, partial [Planctomycetales bacterium]|nr:SOS response-associated peptidase family protein [Planctomycetales bacterium]
FAGLWESWQAPDGSPLETFTLITTDANETTRPIHDRMPVILSPEAHAMWLDGEFEARQPLLDLLVPFEAEPMRTTPVSRHVNNPRNDDPECVAVQKELF